MSTSLFQKKLHVQEFLRQFNLFNQKQTEIKKLIIQSLQEILVNIIQITVIKINYGQS